MTASHSTELFPSLTATRVIPRQVDQGLLNSQPVDEPVENPFRVLRLEQDISQYELARRANVTKHAILRLEQGMYPDPLPAMLNYFAENYHVPRAKLISDYEAFQVSCREQTGLLFRNIIEELKDWSPEQGHPLQFLMDKFLYNPTHLAKALCISQTVVAYFLKKPVNQKSVPEQLTHALVDAGYPEEQIYFLILSYQRFRMYYLKKQKASHSQASHDKVANG